MTLSTQSLSAAWLEGAQRRVNADPAFRKLGSIDIKVAINVDAAAYLVTFAGFTCHSVASIDANEMRDADIIVTMSADQWDRFIAGRRTGNGRTLLDLDTTEGVVTAVNPRKKLDFLRFHTSLQAFFDAGATADTQQAA